MHSLYKEGSGGPPPENFGKSSMQENHIFRLILYIFIFH